MCPGCVITLCPYVVGTFISLGLSGCIPALHYVITDGFHDAVKVAALGWLVLMAFLYISGAVIYAIRIPERIWPGKFDIWVSVFPALTLFGNLIQAFLSIQIICQHDKSSQTTLIALCFYMGFLQKISDNFYIHHCAIFSNFGLVKLPSQ